MKKIEKIILTIFILSIIFAGTNSAYCQSKATLSTWFIKTVFESGAKKANKALEKHLPEILPLVFTEHYDLNDKDAFLDVYYPDDTSQVALPTVVWVHGGGWIAGHKSEMSNYYKILAARGFTVVSVDYTLAPKQHYPYQINQLNKALEFLVANAEKLRIDTTRLFLAGDSGGASIVAQYANILTVDSYAKMVGIEPLINKQQLVGVLLYCGVYDIEMFNVKGSFGWFIKTIGKAYSGNKNFLTLPYFKTISVINYVSADFPPAYISVGNDDPLAQHSIQLARKLSDLGVPVDTLFFEENYRPKQPHEYQSSLDTEAGSLTLERSIEFLKQSPKFPLRDRAVKF